MSQEILQNVNNMADPNLGWSEETYRLDEVAKHFKLPQLIQVTEGIDTGNEVDSFSAEDVLMIDQCVTLQKVAAQFAEKLVEVAQGGSEYAILKEEILIPLNYKGKLKVMNEIKRYHSVWDLAREFPRYATVLQALSVPTESGGVLDIAAGTKIELDRVIPGHRTGQTKEPDRLVISTESGGRKQVAMPFDLKARFRSVRDENEYTLKETVDRYSLPKVIRFLDNQIQKIYTQDLLEGVEQMANVTASALQINRLILQRVLIGHYTEPGQSRKASEKFCKRTLVVIPLDLPGVREISIKVHIGEEDDPIYEAFLVKNVNADKTDSVDIAEGLYVEFLKKPRIIRLKEDQSEESGEESNEEEPEEEPPPIPPRPGQKGHGEPPPIQPKPKPKPKERKPKPESKPKGKGDYIDFQINHETNTRTTQEEDEEPGDYEVPENPPISPKVVGRGASSPSVTTPGSPKVPSRGTKQNSSTLSFPIADIAFEKAGHPYENVKKEKQHKDKNVLGKFTGLFKAKKPPTEIEAPKQDDVEKSLVVDEEIGESLYDEPDEEQLDDYEKPPIPTEPYTYQGNPLQKSALVKARPIAKIQPQTHKSVTHAKEFRLLKKDELEQRLITCGMPEFAKFCVRENLDGEFLYEMKDETLKTLRLSKFYEQKLKKITKGWIPAP